MTSYSFRGRPDCGRIIREGAHDAYLLDAGGWWCALIFRAQSDMDALRMIRLVLGSGDHQVTRRVHVRARTDRDAGVRPAYEFSTENCGTREVEETDEELPPGWYSVSFQPGFHGSIVAVEAAWRRWHAMKTTPRTVVRALDG